MARLSSDDKSPDDSSRHSASAVRSGDHAFAGLKYQSSASGVRVCRTSKTPSVSPTASKRRNFWIRFLFYLAGVGNVSRDRRRNKCAKIASTTMTAYARSENNSKWKQLVWEYERKRERKRERPYFHFWFFGKNFVKPCDNIITVARRVEMYIFISEPTASAYNQHKFARPTAKFKRHFLPSENRFSVLDVAPGRLAIQILRITDGKTWRASSETDRANSCWLRTVMTTCRRGRMRLRFVFSIGPRPCAFGYGSKTGSVQVRWFYSCEFVLHHAPRFGGEDFFKNPNRRDVSISRAAWQTWLYTEFSSTAKHVIGFQNDCRLPKTKSCPRRRRLRACYDGGPQNDRAARTRRPIGRVWISAGDFSLSPHAACHEDLTCRMTFVRFDGFYLVFCWNDSGERSMGFTKTFVLCF